VIEQILEADRYLQVDQVGKARDMYERVVELDPGNAIAVVGLARCALADGDDQEAHTLASRALEIDPENDMARRMEARLSEILATRGADVARPPAAATPGPREMRAVVTEETSSSLPATPAARAAADPPEPGTRPTDPTPKPAHAEPVAGRTSRTQPTPALAKEPIVRKSLFDRLLGR
jgi:tetratricopeptide (TPR) repeat protein